jgi:protein N-terminal methyltransferase
MEVSGEAERDISTKEEGQDEPAASPEGTLVLDVPDQAFYKDGAKYWEKIEPTVDGMLGGLGKLDRIDIQASERFLKNILKVKQNLYSIKIYKSFASKWK